MAGRPRKTISAETYEQMLNAWKRKASARYVEQSTGIARNIVGRVIQHGVPELGLPPFPRANDPSRPYARYVPAAERADDTPPSTVLPEFVTAAAPVAEHFKRPVDDVAVAAVQAAAMAGADRFEQVVKDKIAKYQAQADALEAEVVKMSERGVGSGLLDTYREAFARVATLEQTIAKMKSETIAADQMRKSAEEAAAARMTMRSAVAAAAIAAVVNDKILDSIERGGIQLPETLTPQLLLTLARAAEISANAVEKAMNIERKRTGQPEQTIGVRVGVLLEDCTDDELSEIVERGQLPARLISTLTTGEKSAQERVVQEIIDAEIVEDTGENGRAADG